MKKNFLMLIALFIVIFDSYAGANYYTISSTPTWSNSPGGSNCSCSPSYNSDSVFIQHSISLGSITATSTYIEIGNNAILTTNTNSAWVINSGSYFKINSGSTFDQTKTSVTNNGTVEIDGAWITSSNGNSIANTGNLIINGTFDAKNGSLSNSGYLYIYGSIDIQNYTASNSAYIIGSGTINSANNVTISNSGYVNGASGVNLNNAVNYLGNYPSNGSALSIYSGGSWSGGTPNSCSDNAQINSSLTLSSGNIICDRLIVAKGVTLTIDSGYYVEVCGEIINDGTIVVENGGSINQTATGSEVNSGVGTYQVKRAMGSNIGTTVSYISSPMTSTNTNTLTNNYCNVYAFDPVTQFYAFDYPLNYVGNCNGVSVTFTSNYVLASGDNIMDIGRGYVLYLNDLNTKTFTGTINNKTVTVPISSSNIGGGYGWNGQDLNLVGNPYPSAIDLDAFITANASIIESSVYLWDDDQSGGSGYSSADYLTYNLLGSSVNAPNSGKTFDGKLASGQGFWVIAKDPGNDGGDSYTLTFDNSQRVSGQNSNFFRTSNEKTRMWVGVSLNDTIRAQTLLGFVADASTNGEDDKYDSHVFEGNNSFSICTKGQNGNYAIQGFQPLFLGESQLIPLSIELPHVGQYKLNSLSENFDQLSCILHDKIQHLYFDIMSNDYEFNVNDTSALKNRFELIITKEKFEEVTTSLNIKKDTTVANISNVEGVINEESDYVVIGLNRTIVISSNLPLKKVCVYDLSGKIIATTSASNTQFEIAVPSSGLYLVKAENLNHLPITKKVIVNN